MNENLNLCEILKDCQKGTILYSTVYGYVEFDCIESDCEYPIAIKIPKYDSYKTLTFDGRMHIDYSGECTLFPSKKQRDWSKWVCHKPKKPKFDPKTLKPFDKVLLYEFIDACWNCDFYSHTCSDDRFPYVCIRDASDRVIPYNEETKHLIGTTEEAPEYYRYWED